ncbi:MAG: class I SAM-dependent methyltransferase [Chitinophagia bacterium]|nr:class I SAM-dependent methyltransferase [Chitinophagia bacterium]
MQGGVEKYAGCAILISVLQYSILNFTFPNSTLDYMMNSILRIFSNQTVSKDKFNQQFASGKWECMKSIADLHRYSLINGYCGFLVPPPYSVLDLGCGEGILLDRMPQQALAYYHGIDFSDVAINNAKAKESENVKFSVADITTYTPDKIYDFIVFNESLYYLKNVREVLAKYTPFLTERGYLIISMFHNKDKYDAIWDTLASLLTVVDKATITNAQGHAWTVAVFSKR